MKAKRKQSCWHPYQFNWLKKARKTQMVVATTNGTNDGSISRFLSTVIHFSLETITAKTVSHTRPRFVFVAAPLRANTTLSVNNWPIFYVRISAGDAARKGCARAREVCTARVCITVHTGWLPWTRYWLVRRGFLFVVLFLSPRISSSKFIHTWDTWREITAWIFCERVKRIKFCAVEFSVGFWCEALF